jgi:hypothetical protein
MLRIPKTSHVHADTAQWHYTKEKYVKSKKEWNHIGPRYFLKP